MHFTLVFRGPENEDLSYGLVFTPCPCWVRGSKTLLNLHPDNPHLEAGAVRRLLDQEFSPASGRATPTHCTLIVHPDGHGRPEDLHLLQDELQTLGITAHTAIP